MSSMSSTILPARATKLSSTPFLPRSLLTSPPSEHSLRKQDSGTPDLSTRKSRKQKQGKRKGKHHGLKTIFKQVEKRKIGRGFFAVPWLRFKLSPSEFEHFEQHYQEDGFVQHKLRYDYFPSAHLFVLRMACSVHEYLASSVVVDILQQLRVIARRADSTGEFVKKIGSAAITFNDPTLSKHSPDGSFRHIEARYPGVVIEVSYSQKRRDLPRLADDYILGSDAEIRAVVGLDLDYRGKRATVSIWRPRIQVNAAGEKELVAHKSLADQEFRSEDGNQIGDPQVGLRLRLEDFALKAYADGDASLDDEVFIPAHDLFTYLNDAEEFDRSCRASSKYKAIEPGTRKRARESTPPEELVHDDEARFAEEEKRAEERESHGESSYHGDSRPQPRRKQPKRQSHRS
ncbi:uncharacterized protein Z518_03052 [Rhinocladiella mackenziei CBS 650.93]|uniref:Uncharacterized protein n=1 Tax=Rhinocladiella mackenziei CBS 650.93 TaxID=1442369 RepID=A0A0D2IYD2_9EURO|nr:uncharacterized protein Z518_03052 [Rhinocladiella mackenziei CBS 650.93]KIX08396.1 hypothetical protein Z518_03052 [Rhinocladiella mackenziei CBS 650.93]